MALNIQNLKTRTLTAILFAAVMLMGLLINEVLFNILITIIMIGCVAEFIKITRLITHKKWTLYLLLALPYIVLPFYYFYLLGNYNLSGQKTFSPIIPCTIVFSIWINDTSAYLVGSLIGKTPLSIVSPKKTWEGTIGGIILCTLLIPLIANSFKEASFLHWQQWSAIAFICGIFGTLGDLLDSKLKRSAQIKDSGTFMPGHGGFLDRFDSFMIAVQFVYVYIKIVI